uniref:Uncharacterized protein n=1 Tax=Strongyloides venezuelensis TaxID=75913 RepID=A0A0K0G505_STRVS
MSESLSTPQLPPDSDHDLNPETDKLKQQTLKRITLRQLSKTRPTNDSSDESKPPDDNHPRSDKCGRSHPTHSGFNTHHTYMEQ